jgi:hypothetical protein
VNFTSCPYLEDNHAPLSLRIIMPTDDPSLSRPPRLDILDWETQTNGDIVRNTSELMRRRNATLSSGPTEVLPPPELATGAPVLDAPALRQNHILSAAVGRSAPTTLKDNVTLDMSVTRAKLAGEGDMSAGADVLIRGAVQRRLSERPEEIREAARALSKAISDQIAELNASRPNEPDCLAQQNEFVAFLQTIAHGLDALAESIDKAIAAGSAEKPEPILLGKAGEIARQLSDTVAEGFERNRTWIGDWTIKICVLAAGCKFLQAIGFAGDIASVVTAIMK